MPDLPLNNLQQELNTLDAMFEVLSPKEAALFRAQVARVNAATIVLLNELECNHAHLRGVIARAVQDVRLDFVAQEHDLESTRRERDILRGI